MKKRAMFVPFGLFLLLIMGGCTQKNITSLGDIDNVSMPSNMKIIPPEECSVNGELLCALSGAWFGLWDEKQLQQHLLVVEKIISKDEIILVYAISPKTKGWSRAKGRINDNGELIAKFSNGAVVTYKLLADGKLSATYDRGGKTPHHATAIMKKLLEDNYLLSSSQSSQLVT